MHLERTAVFDGPDPVGREPATASAIDLRPRSDGGLRCCLSCRCWLLLLLALVLTGMPGKVLEMPGKLPWPGRSTQPSSRSIIQVAPSPVEPSHRACWSCWRLLIGPARSNLSTAALRSL